MPRPGIIRADTLDLQDQEAPSAQDHTRQPSHPAPLGAGPAAPHQYAELQHVHDEREAEQEHLVEVWTGRSSHEEQDEDDHPQTMNDTVNGDEDSRLNGHTLNQNGDAEGEDMDMNDTENGHEEGLEDEMMDKISSSPSIDDEDIDFQFVYALHTFVATVEGQANATKGDTMVLLDDSNSYWWLVKVVKDSSIGYLPAEHIETPTERLARLNKHRNIDLCAVMLSDNQEKKKNPLKIAMRRRATPKVEFSMPTYHEPPDIDWSDEENGNGDSPDTEENGQTTAAANHAQSDERSEDHRPNGQAAEVGLVASARNATDIKHEDTSQASRSAIDQDRPSDEILDEELPPRRSKEGTLRNTDSFFKDDTAEPRKITLTPNLLRDDSSGRTSESSQKGGDVWDRIDKNGSNTEKLREEKKKKDKKPGMLSGLFKKKEKKVKVDEAAGGILTQSPASPTESGRASPSALRQGKLQKAPPGPRTTTVVPSAPTQDINSTVSTVAPLALSSSKRDSGPVDPLNGLSKEEAGDILVGHRMVQNANSTSTDAYSASENNANVESRDVTSSSNTSESTPTPLASHQESSSQVSQNSPLAVDTSSQEGSHSPAGATPDESPTADEPSSDPKSSTDMSSRSMPESVSPGATTNSSRATTPVAATPPPDGHDLNWDDAGLRTYLDESSNTDVRNLLLLVHDKTGIVPLSRDHPVMVGLGFQEHQKQINDISSRLDGLLNGYLARKSGVPPLATGGK